MSWHFVERWLQKVNQHSTLIGKFWITFLIIFRIVVVSSVSDRVYSDEQSEFKCNTQQVGCPNVCFNQFSPLSHIRFWSFQIIMVTTPSIMFMVYSAHQVKKKPLPKEKSTCSQDTPSPVKKVDESRTEKDFEKRRKKKSVRRMGGGRESGEDTETEKRRIKQLVLHEMFGDDKLAFSQHYILYGVSVVARTAIEVFFIYLQYEMFGFRIPEIYKCEGDPCPNTIDCFISRPMEKTIFLWFMFVIAIICAGLNVLELYYLFWQFGVRRSRLERKKRKIARRSGQSPAHFDISDAEILDGGVLSIQNQPPPPDYKGVANHQRIEGVNIMPAATASASKIQPLATSVSLDGPLIQQQLERRAKYGNDYVNDTPENRSVYNQAFQAPVQVVTLRKDQSSHSNENNQQQQQQQQPKGTDYFNYI